MYSSDGNRCCLQQHIVCYWYKSTMFPLAVHICVQQSAYTLWRSQFLQKRVFVSSSRKKCFVSIKRKDFFFFFLFIMLEFSVAGYTCCPIIYITLFTTPCSCSQQESPQMCSGNMRSNSLLPLTFMGFHRYKAKNGEQSRDVQCNTEIFK